MNTVGVIAIALLIIVPLASYLDTRMHKGG